jgi:hypothetical protein
MAKKSRRARAKVRATQQIVSNDVVKSSVTAAAEAPIAVQTGTKTMKLATPVSTIAPGVKYKYIVPEMIRIGIISGILFVICIVLSLIIK